MNKFQRIMSRARAAMKYTDKELQTIANAHKFDPIKHKAPTGYEEKK